MTVNASLALVHHRNVTRWQERYQNYGFTVVFTVQKKTGTLLFHWKVPSYVHANFMDIESIFRSASP